MGCLSSGSYNLLHIERLIGHCEGTSSGRFCIKLRCLSYLKEKSEGIISYFPASRILSYGLNGWSFSRTENYRAGKMRVECDFCDCVLSYSFICDV